MIIKLEKYLKHTPLKTIRNIILKLFVTSRKKSLAVELQQIDSTSFNFYPKASLDLEGRWNCISCDLCSKVCPTNCITIKSKSKAIALKSESNTPPQSFEIKLKHCQQCGLCADVCPTQALSMQGQYVFSDFAGAVNLVPSKEK